MAAPYLIWNMTRECNFACHYCYFSHSEEAASRALPVEALLDFLGSTGLEWLVGMTGGEPFLYPDFTETCLALTEKHRIGVDTNLSLAPKVREFADRIDPARVNDVYASLHIEEREKRGCKQDFTDNALYLLERGFPLKVNYVLHPGLIDRYEQDEEWFALRGVPLTPRPFKGVYQNREYPLAYDEQARDILARHPGASSKMVYNFRGVPCEAGRTFLRMDQDGTVYRCSGDKTALGHILSGVKLLDRALPCRVNRCPCQGLDRVRLTPAQRLFLDGLTHAVANRDHRAMESFSQVLALDPGHSAAQNNLGVLHHRAGNKRAALAFFSLASGTHPDKHIYARNKNLVETNGDEPEFCPDLAPDKDRDEGRATSKS